VSYDFSMMKPKVAIGSPDDLGESLMGAAQERL